MGEREINSEPEPVVIDGVIYWRIFAGSVLTRHTAPPDAAVLTNGEMAALCEKSTRVDVLDFEMHLPAIWRPWWGQLASEERAAVWRGCRTMYRVMTGPRW